MQGSWNVGVAPQVVAEFVDSWSWIDKAAYVVTRAGSSSALIRARVVMKTKGTRSRCLDAMENSKMDRRSTGGKIYINEQTN